MKDHIVFSVGPDDRWSRHSEGSFLRLRDGRIMLLYSRFTSRCADDAPSDLAAAYSSDEGEHWTEPVTAIRAAQWGVENIMSVTLMRMRDGSVGAYYIIKADAGISKIMLSRSYDEGGSWTRHTECTLPDRRGYYVLNNDRVERLSTGRLVMPLTFHRGGHQTDGSVYFDGRGVAVFLLSDDDGETWREAADTGRADGLC